ncbi:hypothetical protein [Delftia tsuruhatensis]|uniref:hypothetical protein n=1 Tax=Delftia tsuruhatensis TaxID=180282 RepID=UPI0012A89FA1|nr:hypothetical protein [Delftia tsuruhatensis]QFS64819.1 hypothetical protein GCS91_11115 [Delftia tsuruhatensis]
MLIKFKKPDPRAGMVACMDSSRGQQLIDAGAADQVSESVTQEQPADVQQPAEVEQTKAVDAGAADQAPAAAPKPARGKK